MWVKNNWLDKDFVELEKYLFFLKDAKYRDFHSKLVPGVDDVLPIIGVRLPILRKIAGEIAKGNGESFLRGISGDYYEKVMLKAIVIGNLRSDFKKILGFIEDFIPQINNWAICDSFVSGLTVVKKNREEFYTFLSEYLHSEDEYKVRFAVISIMDYYTDSQYISEILEIYDSISHNGYYVKMAVAWGLSVAYVKEKEKTMAYLKNNNLDNWTYNKALQKIIESNRVTKEEKTIIRTMKRKNPGC
ncbi:MAG: DNA alkylation repair protein [Clostridiales bacterium]